MHFNVDGTCGHRFSSRSSRSWSENPAGYPCAALPLLFLRWAGEGLDTHIFGLIIRRHSLFSGGLSEKGKGGSRDFEKTRDHPLWYFP